MRVSAAPKCFRTSGFSTISVTPSRRISASSPGVALRLLVAHGIAGRHLFRASPDPQTTLNAEVRDSLDNGRAEAMFDTRRRAVLALLGTDAEAPTVIGASPEGAGYDGALVTLFYRLLDLDDAEVMTILTIVIGEALASGSPIIEAVGLHLGVRMADYWSADPAFFALLRDRAVTTAILTDVAGATIATAKCARDIGDDEADRYRPSRGHERAERGRELGAALDGVSADGLHRTWRCRDRIGARQGRGRSRAGATIGSTPRR